MEFPNLGQHCGVPTCGQLDFLPVKCDACAGVFCHGHFSYAQHTCPSAYKKDVQVPVCPLCSSPVPLRRGVAPDVVVGEHMDADCRSPQKRVYANACARPKCKRKEMVPVRCVSCKENFCLQHRHEADHDCQGPPPTHKPAAAAGLAAWVRSKTAPAPAATGPPSAPRDMRNVLQGGLSEDEALARAMQASMGVSEAAPAAANGPRQRAPGPRSAEDEDRDLAEAIVRSQDEAAAPARREKSCVVH